MTCTCHCSRWDPSSGPLGDPAAHFIEFCESGLHDTLFRLLIDHDFQPALCACVKAVHAHVSAVLPDDNDDDALDDVQSISYAHLAKCILPIRSDYQRCKHGSEAEVLTVMASDLVA